MRTQRDDILIPLTATHLDQEFTSALTTINANGREEWRITITDSFNVPVATVDYDLDAHTWIASGSSRQIVECSDMWSAVRGVIDFEQVAEYA